MKNYLLLLALFYSAVIFAQQNKGVNPLKTNATGSTNSTRRAVVVGISDYQDPAIPDLRFADKDALAFATYLRSPSGGALDADHLQLLTNAEATAGQVAAAFDWLVEQSKEGDEAILYFSGHGDVERKTISQPGFLLCWDAPARVYMGGGTYSLAFLQEIVTTLSTQNKAKVVVVTDACHAGKLAGSQIGGAQATAANLVKQFANEVKILSCQPNEFSLEGEQWGGGRGVFSYHLIDALYGLADKNTDGGVTLSEIDRYLEDHVTAEAAPQSQVPMLLGNKTERMALVNAAILADLQAAKSKQQNAVVFTPTEGRGLEDDVLASVDTSVRRQYADFKKALKEKAFFKGRNGSPSADYLYGILSKEPGLAPLHGFLKRNYAAALQDDAQQVLNKWLKADPSELYLSKKTQTGKYLTYPRQLERAAELLGKEHYMYTFLQARKYLFEGYLAGLSYRGFDDAVGKKALGALREALRWQPDMPQAYWQIGVVFDANFGEEDSLKYYALKAAELAPSWVVPYTTLANAAMSLGGMSFTDVINLQTNKRRTFDEARAYLEKANAVDSTSMEVQFTWGQFYEAQGDHEKAVQFFRNALDRDSGFVPAHNALGLAYSQMHRFPEAEAEFLKTVRLDSTLADARNNLGLTYRILRKLPAAEIELRKALELDSSIAAVYTNLATVYRNMRRFEEAEPLYKKAIQLSPGTAGYYSNLGILYGTTNRQLEAVEQFKEAIRRDSTDAQFPFNLGFALIELKRPEEAEVNLNKARELEPGYTPVVHFSMAIVRLQQGQPEKAFESLEEALKTGFDNFPALQQEASLAPLREQKERWDALMKKYFPKEFKG